ncbi:hypothetical protein FSST1_000178 [Fusarium sambucinum]
MPPSNGKSYRRAHVACKACKARKVRCTVTLSGPPCANCTVDNVPCEIQTRKRRRNGDILSRSSDVGTPDSPLPLEQSPSSPTPLASQSGNPSQVNHASAGDHEPRQWASPSDSDRRTPLGQSQSAQNSSSLAVSQEVIFVGDNTVGDENAVALDTDVDDSRQTEKLTSRASTPIANATSAWAETLEQRESSDSRVPFYPGDKRGPAFVIDICRPQRQINSNHTFVTLPPLDYLLPEEVEYLRFKGCFSLPPQSLREALLRAYFHHSHPFEPVLDPQDFFNNYSKGNVSLLLLWNIFMCAASFVDNDLFSANFYDSQIAFKRTAFQRAKALYDADYEKNKITLIQSVFLMGHFYANAEDRMGPWHWNGIAISLSHTIGLHMLTSPARDGIQPLWRRVWWCIYYREVWLSMGQGRPMRISLDHCSTPMLGLYDTSPGSSPEFEQYLPEQLGTLLGMWLKLIGVTRVMGEILSNNYAIRGTKPSKAVIERYENEIHANWYPDGHRDQSPVLLSHLYQFRLQTQAAIIALYRPFLHELPDGVPVEEHDAWKTLVNNKLRTAASHATHAVNCMMAEGLIKFAQSISVLAIIPPVQVHLLEMATSKSSSSTQLAKHNLALCLLALDEMRMTYISADAGYKLFDRARTMIEKTRQEAEVGLRDSTISPERQGIETAQWLDDSASYDLTSAGVLSALWAPFANIIPDDFSGYSS